MPTIADEVGERLQTGRVSRQAPSSAYRIAIMSWGVVGEYVRRARAIRRQTQADFAREVGLSVRTVGALEAGEQRSYDETTIARVESTLGWSPGSFDRVVNGLRPVIAGDPYLARIVDGWPRLSTDFRRIIAELVALCLTEHGGRQSRPSDTDDG